MPNNLTRKQFLRAAAVLAASPWLPRLSHAETRKINMTEIAPGLFVHHGEVAPVSSTNLGDISNACLIVGKDALAVVDTGGSAAVGKGLLEAVRAISDKPIKYVINTHMHPDHVFGNAPFVAEKATFVAHHKMARGLAARAEVYLRSNKALIGEEGFAGTEIVLPTMPISEPQDLDLGERIITLVPRPTAHTDNDLTIFDKATGTLIAGDLLFSEHIPTIDGSIVGWLALIEVLRKEEAARVVPGHGPASLPWPSSLDPLDQYLRSIADDVRAMIKENKTLTEATKTAGASEKGKWKLADEFHVRNVTAAFAELEWE